MLVWLDVDVGFTTTYVHLTVITLLLPGASEINKQTTACVRGARSPGVLYLTYRNVEWTFAFPVSKHGSQSYPQTSKTPRDKDGKEWRVKTAKPIGISVRQPCPLVRLSGSPRRRSAVIPFLSNWRSNQSRVELKSKKKKRSINDKYNGMLNSKKNTVNTLLWILTVWHVKKWKSTVQINAFDRSGRACG